MTRLALMFAVLVLLVLGWPGGAWAAEPSGYTLPETVVAATVKGDGSVRVVEDHTYRFVQGGHGAYLDVPQVDGARVSDVVVEEGGSAYELSGTPELGVERPAGTYAEGDCTGGAHRVVWYFAAEPGATRTFRVSYTLRRGVTAYDRHAFLHLPVWGSGWRQDLELLRVSVKLPRKGAKGGREVYRVYGRGVHVGLSRDRRTAAGSARGVAAGRAVSLDLAFPAAQLAKAGDGMVRRKGSGAGVLAGLKEKVPEAGVSAECLMGGMPAFPVRDAYSSGGGGTRAQSDYTGLLLAGLVIVIVVTGLASKGRRGAGGGASYRRRHHHHHTWGSSGASGGSGFSDSGSSSGDSGGSGGSGSSSSDGGGGAW
ncbi:MAG: DUF2207 domain-containing protein [Nonomuraea sp.]|nr:DUF2207 domain-containing protein [Nonomuraea sp.]